MADFILIAVITALCVGSLAFILKRKGKCCSNCKNCSADCKNKK